MKDIMIDIETMGHGGNTALVQLSAVQFDRYTGKKGLEFSTNIDLQSCIDVGLKIKADTIYWWLTKSEQAINSITNQPRSLIQLALMNFSIYLSKCAPDGVASNLHLWGRSPRFDIAIIYDAYIACSLVIQWDKGKEMCVRTIESFAPEVKKEIDEKNKTRILHDGISDCLHQIEYVSEIYKRKKL
jgi:hypothetical protein